MQKHELRRVRIRFRDEGEICLFHQWVTKTIHRLEGSEQYLEAAVETADGEMFRISENDIIFKDQE
jgi:hypothetical protein